jgi:hypothetical protein
VRQYLTLLGIPLLPQGIAQRYSRFGRADCFCPCWLSFRLRRLRCLSHSWHHGQPLRRHYRAALEGLHCHWANRFWFAFRYLRVDRSRKSEPFEPSAGVRSQQPARIGVPPLSRSKFKVLLVALMAAASKSLKVSHIGQRVPMRNVMLCYQHPIPAAIGD